ncbi:hypothetical protein [Streptomyces bohaiensis]|uniref:hypothetical protein n=1 Tax=Streptomyces bohaiensis TaxID=1431344 RepID=UPI0030C6634F
MVDVQEVLENVLVAVFALQSRNGDLLFVGKTLKGSHRRFQGGFRAVLGAGSRFFHGFCETLFQNVVPLRQEFFLLPCAPRSAMAGYR